jgi:heme-degrading monooxygenase HmoA
MFVLHVEMKVEPGSRQGLEQTYIETFRPAISRQEGFRNVELLRPHEEGEDYRLSIAFDRQALQQKWIATDLHQQVWPQIENRCTQYSVRFYDAVQVNDK